MMNTPKTRGRYGVLPPALLPAGLPTIRAVKRLDQAMKQRATADTAQCAQSPIMNFPGILRKKNRADNALVNPAHGRNEVGG